MFSPRIFTSWLYIPPSTYRYYFQIQIIQFEKGVPFFENSVQFWFLKPVLFLVYNKLFILSQESVVFKYSCGCCAHKILIVEVENEMKCNSCYLLGDNRKSYLLHIISGVFQK